MTRIGIGTALSLRSAQSARLHELVKLPIRALLSWRIRELCCGNDAYFRASHFPGDSCVAARCIGPEVTAFRCASRQVRRANRWSMDHRRGIELYARLHRVSSFPYGTRVCEAVGRLGRRRSLLGGCMPRQRSAISAERLQRGGREGHRAAQGALLESGKVMIENLTREQYDTVLRQDFVTFAARCFHDLRGKPLLATLLPRVARWGQAWRRVTEGRRNRSSALGKAFRSGGTASSNPPSSSGESLANWARTPSADVRRRLSGSYPKPRLTRLKHRFWQRYVSAMAYGPRIAVLAPRRWCRGPS